MNTKTVKGFYIGSFSLLSLFYILIITSLLIRKVMMQPIESSTNQLLYQSSPNYLIATLILILATLIGFINSLSLPPTSRNEVEKIILPIVFTLFTFLTMPTIVKYLLINHQFTISFTILVRFYLFSVYFSFTLLVISGIFSLGINSSKISRYILLLALLSLFIATLMHLNVASYPLQSLKWADSSIFISTLSLIGFIAIGNYFAIWVRESTQHNMLKALRILLIVVGILGYIFFPESIASLISTIIYTIGILFGLSRKRFNQL